MTPELLIFDCDGVLIDSEALVCNADAEELTRIGYPITGEEMARRFAGVPGAVALAELEREMGRPLPEGFHARCEAKAMALYRSELRALPRAAETIAALPFPRCVASSSRPAKLALGLVETGLYELFYPHLFSTVLVANGKPAPDLFLHAAAALGATTAGCLVIEDSIAGVTAARAAGMRIVGFTGGSHCGADHGERLRAAGAVAIVPGYAELPAAIAALD
ncbi:haloacid dehalogenase superfamily, subfamily IA, variant 3 with third motif having DD or ED [Tistlia consotensis]|uniref:Haloacid dehalogenase superfamily, subfamily IA, variant 3 with third motif having DD or ED n=1 Tax=Tistlia consotensis USBA 355 TaxID=560819 RepID=A0A1Y6BGI1_9PROT|nr:HAD-IA family hydrolase [Tistlia consotensis]SMF02867.1 haloacid dehalogenase superfamily, subfamily IA, variant 3 with third motif having DD or ED [Tistlia consotensis USBA 355]SNR53162.1 haloacid dehalogenase superfamily, subfamily IA, variant 3 with third motif having DD or ED [Tistlia consotensis]